MRRALEPPFAVGALALLVFAVWLAKDAGYAPATWYTGGLFLVALAAVALLTLGRAALSLSALAALAFLGAFATWSTLSIAWAGDQGIAWDGANRTLLYFVVFALFVLLPWRRESIPLLLGAFSLVALGVGLADLARGVDHPTSSFLLGRFSAPAGYPNAACAVYMFAFWPLAYMAARREPPPVVRGLLLGAATALVGLAVLTQSRGSLFAVPAALVCYVLIVPQRLRAALPLCVVAVGALFARSRLLAVFEPVRLDQANAGELVRSALLAIAVASLCVAAAWTVVALLDRRVHLTLRTVRAANIAAVVVVVAAAAAGVYMLATVDVSAKWRHFKAGYPEQQSGASHFSSGLGSNRYDFWRVAVREFRAHPLQGVGADNFANDYVRLRRSSEEPLYPHSLAVRLPAQTGVVGTVLFAGFVIAAALAVTRRSIFTEGVARAGVAAVVYYGLHGAGDWLWEFAGLGAPAFAWLGLAASKPVTSLKGLWPFRIGVAVVALAIAVSFVFPWLADLETRRALRIWADEPAGAFKDLARAQSFNPLSSRPDLVAGAIASRTNDLPRMKSAFARAASRTPDDWYAHFELALAEAALHERGPALAELARSKTLNPGEEAIRSVTQKVVERRPVNRNQIDEMFVARVRARVGP